MNLLIVISISSIYLLTAQRFFQIWLRFFQQDTDMSSDEKVLSWGVLLIGTALWPIVVPISYLTLLERKLAGQKETLRRAEITGIDTKTLVHHPKQWTAQSCN